MSGKSPLVSIIIPMYNVENQIAVTINSALAQTWQNKEIIIIDDGSADNSFSIAESFAGQRIRIFHQKNRGASTARNIGLKEAKGEYIQFLDADDLLSPYKIEEQIKILNGDLNKIAICPTIHFFDGENHLSNKPSNQEISFLYSTKNAADFLINLYGGNGRGGMIPIHSWLTPKNLLDKIGLWNEYLSIDDDGEYFCRVVLSAEEILFTSKVFSYYRKYKNGNNLANQRSQKALKSAFIALRLKEKYLFEKTIDKRVHEVFASAYFNLAVSCFPQYKALSKLFLKKRFDTLNKRPKLYIGSKSCDFMANTFSWKLARYIQYYKHKLIYYVR